jgi:hypothetical protein
LLESFSSVHSVGTLSCDCCDLHEKWSEAGKGSEAFCEFFPEFFGYEYHAGIPEQNLLFLPKLRFFFLLVSCENDGSVSSLMSSGCVSAVREGDWTGDCSFVAIERFDFGDSAIDSSSAQRWAEGSGGGGRLVRSKRKVRKGNESEKSDRLRTL